MNRKMNRKMLAAAIAIVVAFAAAAADVEICKYGGTNDPYTAENPLACDNFTYYGAGSGNAGVKPDSLASFLGGTHTIAGKLLTSGLCNKYSKNADLVISGATAVVSANYVEISSARNTDQFNKTVDGIPFRTRVFVRDGATLVSATGLRIAPSLWYEPQLSIENATLQIDAGNLDLYNTSSKGFFTTAGSEVLISDSSALMLGRADFYQQGLMFVSCTDTVFRAGSMSVYAGVDATFKRCEMFMTSETETTKVSAGSKYGLAAPRILFEDCLLTNVNAKALGWSSTRYDDWGRMTISGGNAYFSALGVGGGASGGNFELSITNGASVVVNSDIAIGDRATGTVAVVGSSLRMRGDASKAYVGYSPNAVSTESFGSLTVGREGSADFGLKELTIGQGAPGRIDVIGGTLTARVINIGANASTLAAGSSGSCLHVKGGKVDNVPSGTDGWSVTCVGKFAGSGNVSLVLEDCEYETLAILGGEGCSSYMLADGATIRPTLNYHNRPLVSGLTTAEVGANGLTFEVPLGFTDIYVTQSFTNRPGVSATVTKAGKGDLTLSSADWCVGKAVVEDGRLNVGVDRLSTALVVTNGAILSMQDGAAGTLTVDSLKILGGVLELDPGDRIVVLGETDISAMSLVLSSKPEYGLTVIESGSMTEGSAAALVRAMAGGFTYDDGTYGKFTVSESGGSVSVTFAIEDLSEPLSGDALTVWQGASAGGWGAVGSWSAGVPDIGRKAVFPAAAAAKSVEVPANARATAVSFGGGYALTSGPLTLDGDRGAVEMEATAGSTTISAPVEILDIASVPVAPGAKLRLAGPLEVGGFTKTGDGRLELAAPGTLVLPVTLSGGTVSLSHGGAFGESAVKLTAGTLEVKSGSSEETFIGNQVSVNVPSQYGAVVFKTDTPARIRAYTPASGAFIKRGAAPLTIECRDSDSLTGQKACLNMNAVQSWLEFAEDGTAPDNGDGSAAAFTAFTIAEGEVVLRAADGETMPTVFADDDGTYIGIRHTNGTVRARLTLDGVRYDCGTRSVFLGGFNAGNDNIGSATIKLVADLLKSELCITNGAELKCGRFTSASYGNKPGMTPTLAMTNGTMTASTVVFSFNNATPAGLVPTACSVVRAKDSTITASDGFSTMLKTDAEFDNTFLGTASGAPGKMTFTLGAAGTMLFRSGAVFAVDTFDFTKFRDTYRLEDETMTLAFDDAEWRFGDGDCTFDPVIPNDASSSFAVELRGAGVKLAPAAGATFITRFPFSGKGGVQVAGPGTVAFAAGTVNFSGVAEVKQGTLDLSAAGTVSGIGVKGPGTVRGATLVNPTISLEVDDEWGVAGVPVFDGCAISGRVRVDCGRTEENPLAMPGDTPVVVARFSGSAPDVSGWRLAGVGAPGMRGKFSVQGDAVVMTVFKSGFGLIFR